MPVVTSRTGYLRAINVELKKPTVRRGPADRSMVPGVNSYDVGGSVRAPASGTHHLRTEVEALRRLVVNDVVMLAGDFVTLMHDPICVERVIHRDVREVRAGRTWVLFVPEHDRAGRYYIERRVIAEVDDVS